MLVGFDNSDDAAIYKLSDEIAIVQTLDFFSPVVADPYTFGKIAAANALSDVYAMGAEVKVALNIVAYPEKLASKTLGEILRGGAEKVHEAGGVLSGGHSVDDPLPKYGLSVTGVVHPDRILKNKGCKVGDKIILTKPLGTGIIMTAYNLGEISEKAYYTAIQQMETLNKYAAKKMLQYEIHACTDVTGFGFLGHLDEMTDGAMTICVNAQAVPYIEEAYESAAEFMITGAGQKNRNFLKGKLSMENIAFPMEEILFDPQTSGGLLISVASGDADKLLSDLNTLEFTSSIVAEVTDFKDYNIIVK